MPSEPMRDSAIPSEHAAGCPALYTWDVPGACTCGMPSEPPPPHARREPSAEAVEAACAGFYIWWTHREGVAPAYETDEATREYYREHMRQKLRHAYAVDHPVTPVDPATRLGRVLSVRRNPDAPGLELTVWLPDTTLNDCPFSASEHPTNKVAVRLATPEEADRIATEVRVIAEAS